MNLSEYGLDDEVKDFLNQQSDFLIDRVSQEGGNCDIFFGFHKIFGRRIALKIYYGNDNVKSHYEPRILSNINHENILRVYDARRIGSFYSYFMTDEISGGDLEKYHQANKLDLKDKLNIIHGVLNGLTELHNEKNSIVHRDLKPKNILIYKDSKQPLISDFGSVRQFDKDQGSVTGSKTTLIYTPKEVFENNKYTKQSDIYQVGIILFQILDGNFPSAYFEWLNEKEKNKFLSISGHYEQSVFLDKVIQKLVSKNNLIQLDSLPKYIHPSIVKVIQKAIHPTLKVRFQNTSEFMNELYKIQKKLVNWKKEDDIFYASKPKGENLRIVPNKKGFSIEKHGTSGWRRNSEFVDDINLLFSNINS